ncbi:MAG: hypothetical protein IT384_06600 [Deltaproteobacteria bacterium]|nr:hypothetical protein [Deltaproteobacteria bacterium]
MLRGISSKPTRAVRAVHGSTLLLWVACQSASPAELGDAAGSPRAGDVGPGAWPDEDAQPADRTPQLDAGALADAEGAGDSGSPGPQLGDRCQSPIDLNLLDGTPQEIVLSELARYHLDDAPAACSLIDGPGVVDVYVSLTAPRRGRANLRVLHPAGDSFDPVWVPIRSVLIPLAGCSELGCQDASSYALWLDLEPGVTQRVRVLFEPGSYEGRSLILQAAFREQCGCDERPCGNDDCGRSCGDCPALQACSIGGGGSWCEVAASSPGESCAHPRIIDGGSLPFVATASVASIARDHRFPCLSDGLTGDWVFELRPPVDGRYAVRGLGPDPTRPFQAPHTELVIGTDCDTICETAVARGRREVSALLDADQTYFILAGVYAAPTDPPVLSLEISAPCVPACDGKACGPDGCGASCGVCDADRGMECVEPIGQCRPLADVCSVDLGGTPCTALGSSCTQECEAVEWCEQCFVPVCEQHDFSSPTWIIHHHYPETRCDLERCGTLPAEIAFTYSLDFTSATADVPLDPETGVCGAGSSPAISFGWNGLHSELALGLNGWTLLAASDGTLYPEINALLSFPHDRVIGLEVLSPAGRRFRVDFRFGAHLRLEAITAL